MNRIQREFTAAGATLAKITELWCFKESIDESDDDDVKFPEPLKVVENVRQTLKDIDHYLNTKRGVDGVFLAYVTRKATAIPDNALDYGEPTFDDKMILRASHTGNTYQQDNRRIWTML
jgi:hypothetical protein